MDQVSDIRCRELLGLLRKISQAVDLHSKYLNKNFFFERQKFESLGLDDCNDEPEVLSYAMALN